MVHEREGKISLALEIMSPNRLKAGKNPERPEKPDAKQNKERERKRERERERERE